MLMGIADLFQIRRMVENHRNMIRRTGERYGVGAFERSHQAQEHGKNTRSLQVAEQTQPRCRGAETDKAF